MKNEKEGIIREENMHQSKCKLIWLIILIMISISFLLAFGHAVIAEEYPTRPVTLIIPYPPGGVTDMTARLLAGAAAKYLSEPIIFENKGGGAGTVGTTITVSKPPDGYTLGTMSTSNFVAWHMGKLHFNPVDDVTHIIRYISVLNGVVVREDSEWKTGQELIEYCKQNPGKVTYGSPGVGSTNHLPMVDLGIKAGITWTHVPFVGDAGTLTALLGGHVDVGSMTAGAFGPLVEAGKVRLLWLFSEQRCSNWPNVPTMKEIGYDVTAPVVTEVMGPKGIPKPIVEKVHDAFKKALDDTAFLALVNKLGLSVSYLNPEDCKKHTRQDSEQIKEIVKKLGLYKQK